jgi:integrase
MAKAKRIDITDAVVAAIPFEPHGDKFYRDRSLKGFSLRVGKRSKVFSCRADYYVDGRRVCTRRPPLGAVGEISADMARTKAMEAMRRVRATGSTAQPGDPAKTTLRDVWPRYEAVMRKDGASPRTIADYADKIRLHLADWLDRPIASITRDEVHRRHELISEASGPFAANGSCRVGRALWNFASDNLELPAMPSKNPFRSTRRDRLYAKEKARRNGMATAELPAWMKQLRELPPLRASMHLFTLMSGMRRTTVLTMRWADVDFATATLAVPAPKGGKPMQLPLSRPTALLLRFARRQGRMLLGQDSPWCWPSPESRDGHMVEVKERKLSAFGHRLRSSYATIAEEAAVSIIARKALMAHAIPNDVTQKHYVNRAALAPEFRKAQERISALIVTTVAPDERRARNIVGRLP